MFPKTELPILPDHLKWRCETLSGGGEVEGIMAGNVVVVRTHWNGTKTLPCLHDMTCGKLFCPCTVKPMSGTHTGYTPLITRELERLVVPASPLVTYELQKFNPGKLIKLKRTKIRCAPLKIEIPTSEGQGQAWVQRLRNTCTHNIEEYLLHLWQLPVLNEFFGVDFRPALGSPLKGEGRAVFT